MSDRFYELRFGHRTRRLSLAVTLVDAVTGGRPVGGQRISIDGVDAEPVANRSGYHCFFDLDADTVTLRVDGGDRYLDVSRAGVEVLDLSDPETTVDPSDPATLPVETVELQPSPAYEFPGGTAHVRGHVRDADGDPVADATVSIEDVDRSATTAAGGEFVLFLDPVADDDVAVVDGLVEVDGSNPTLAATHGTLGTTTETVEVAEGALTTRDVRYD